MPTCQELTDSRLTELLFYVPIDLMVDTIKATAKRLRLTRIALGYEQPSEFLAELGIDKGDYSKLEAGKKELNLRIAKRIKKRFGVSLDWLIDGDLGSLRRELAEEIIKLFPDAARTG